MENGIYIKKLFEEIPRLLSLEDRDFASETFGCFDRSYWAWKFKDFPDATLQRAVYPLSVIWKTEFEGNIYFHNQNLADWIKASVLFWAKIQKRNGSFDQAFPNEFSFGATAFTVYPIIESFFVISDFFSSAEKKLIKDAIINAADFLRNNAEVHGFISNHLAGAALSLYKSGCFLNDERYKIKAKEIIDLIISNQSKEGWYKEYEGPDPGYETLGISYLAKYYAETKDENLLKSLKKALYFLSYFLHPDGTIGGEYGSRNTEIFYPAGIEILKNKVPLAAAISAKTTNEPAIFLKSLDKENLIALAVNYADAGLGSNNISGAELPFEKNKVEIFFDKSKLFVLGNNNYYAVCNGSKGGLIKVFDKKKNKLVLDDCGYIGQINGGKTIATQIFNPQAKVNFDSSKFEVETEFMGVLGSAVSPLKMIALRMLNVTIFNSVFFGNLVKKAIINLLVLKKTKFPVRLKREIIFNDNSISIKDTIEKKSSLRFNWLRAGKKFSAIHMGSAKYFNYSQLLKTEDFKAIDINELNRSNKIAVINKFIC